jgi:DNA-binding NtrC family response regulator
MESKRKTVVLAEDDRELRRLLAQLIRLEGYDVVEIGSGDELLAWLDDSVADEMPLSPNVILCDVGMPGFTGMEILEYLRATGNLTPVILMTAFGDRQMHREASRLGAAGMFDKPFEADDMIAAIHSCLL